MAKKKSRKRINGKLKEIFIVVGGTLMLLLGIPFSLFLFDKIQLNIEDNKKFKQLDISMTKLLSQIDRETDAQWIIDRSCYPVKAKFPTNEIAGCKLIIKTQSPIKNQQKIVHDAILDNGFIPYERYLMRNNNNIEYEYKVTSKTGVGTSSIDCGLSLLEASDESADTLTFMCISKSNTRVYPLVVE